MIDNPEYNYRGNTACFENKEISISEPICLDTRSNRQKVEDLTKENNKLREALDEIANGPWGETLMRTIALEALSK